MNDGFVTCPKCKGYGIYTFPSKNWDYCTECKGVGRISWLEKIFNKTSKLSVEDGNLRNKNMRNYLKMRGLD
jgi:DnaJ-class molecular chaperone